jgi:hypothetical protein
MSTSIATSRIPLPVKLLTLALLGGGLIGGLLNYFLVSGNWPWLMPPLASRFLAGAAAAYVVGSAIVLTRRDWLESEFLLFTVVAYGIPLGFAVLLQADLIDWSKPVAWEFLGIVTVALAICFYYLWKNRNLAAAESKQPLTSLTHRYLLALGILTTIVGLLVYFIPKQSGFLWPWAALDVWKHLDSRLIASMLLTIAAGALVVKWRNDKGTLGVMLPMLWAYCIVAGSGILLHATTTPAFVLPDIIYIVIFAIVGLGGLFIYRREQRA